MNDLSVAIGNVELDYSFLDTIPPYTGDVKESLNEIDVDTEISRLADEIGSIDIRSIPFNKGDFIVIFVAGLLGACCDLLLGKPADGYGGALKKAHEPAINDSSFGGLGKFLKQYDLKNNPIDKTIPGISVGDHRLYSYGHDLLRFFSSAGMILSGTGPVGISGLGGEISLEQAPSGWLEALEALKIAPGDPQSYFKACIILALHLFKDYCSARSLPIPGMTLIANLNGDKMPKFIDELTNEKELNLRTLNGQVFSVAVIEIVIGLYCFIEKKACKYEEEYSVNQIKNKKEKMLLISHSIAMLFNIGKVCVTKNPAFINVPQIIRILTLAIKCIKNELETNQKSLEKINLSVIKNKYETVQTIILLDQSIYYTSHLDRIIRAKMDVFDTKAEEQKENEVVEIDEFYALLQEYKGLNKE
jgi:hypothetical protein